MRFRFLLLFCAFLSATAFANDANRFAYLDDPDPFYPSRDFPKLITPQWIGEPGVDAAVILSIDDMRDPAKYEAYLRPIIDKLKAEYGTASMSIMACSVTPDDPQLQTWLQEGISIEVHTVAHPCPLLGRGQFDEARATIESCTELMNAIPGNNPVAFRMPCCDSINSTSPRFFHEIFNKPTPGTPRLAIDSSVFNITTANDSALPREWVLREDGRERFRTYLPFPAFKTTIEDYPYPYVIGGTCWEFPCAVPSDWEAQNINKPNSPQSLADMKIALDAAVTKKGVYTLVFHPHGWIEDTQIVELIDHAARTYGDRVRFLSFADAYARLCKNVMGTTPEIARRYVIDVKLLDLNHDGYMDAICSGTPWPGKEDLAELDIDRDGVPDLNHRRRLPEATPTDAPPLPAYKGTCRVWNAQEGRWKEVHFPTDPSSTLFCSDVDGVTFAMLEFAGCRGSTWRFKGDAWWPAPELNRGLKLNRQPVINSSGISPVLRIRDIDGDGTPELLAWFDEVGAVFSRTSDMKGWKKLSFVTPRVPSFMPPDGPVYLRADDFDNGMRLVDVDSDGDLDILISNQERYALHLFESMETGWSTKVFFQDRADGDPDAAIPAIAIDYESNGAWFKSRTLWVQNEHTDTQPDLVERRSFNDLTATVEPKPKSPEASLASITVHPGLRVELVAAEPLVVDPIAIAWGLDGKLWVVEMRDYPLGMDGKGKPGSRVKFLEDADGDGTYDKATVFLDELNFATGVMPWRDGVLVTAAPLVFFAKDTNGDGKADVQETLFDGFVQGNQQHRVNGLRWGLDNWVHLANGDSGGKVTSTKTGETIDVSGRDFRIRPDVGALKTESGNSQYGICFDDWGNRFGCANWLPVWHYVLDETAMQRNPHFAPGNPREYIVEPEKLFPTSRTLTRFNDFEFYNKATSTCGIEIYRDTVLGDEFYGNSFVCEPVHDLVIRTVLEPNGPTFSGHDAPGEEQSEFMTSHDNWFRPVQARTGPDGALYIVDMYRQVIEHPEYISLETQAKLNLRAGDDKGRIYRIVPVHGELRAVPKLNSQPTPELVAQLESPNGTLRDMAQRLLFERADASAAAPLRALLANSKSPLARLHALCGLDGLGALTADDVLAALKDDAPGVRRNAVHLAAPYANDWPGITTALLAMQDDPDPLVHIELLYAFGDMRDPLAAAAIGAYIERDKADPYFGMALLSSLNASNVRSLLQPVLGWAADDDAAADPRNQAIPAVTGIALGANDADGLTTMATLITNKGTNDYEPEQFGWLAEFLDTFEEKGATLDALGASTEADTARTRIAQMIASARKTATGTNMDETRRASAARVIGKDVTNAGADIALLDSLLDSATPESVRSAALGAMLRISDEKVPAAVLAKWSVLSGDQRSHALDTMMWRERWLAVLMSALESGKPSFRELDAAHRQRLLTSKNDDIRARAETLMAGSANPNRQAVVEQYKEAATIPGQFLRGRHIFRERCASCHQLGTAGHAVGPDLTAITDRSPEAVLVSILDPNRAVETKYFNYTIETNDLMTYNGIVVEESGNSVKLRSANGIENTVLRSDIESMATESRSPMPDGLEDGLTPEDLANLIAYILDTSPKD